MSGVGWCRGVDAVYTPTRPLAHWVFLPFSLTPPPLPTFYLVPWTRACQLHNTLVFADIYSRRTLTITAMPVLDVYPKNRAVSTLRSDESSASPTMTLTLNSGNSEPSGQNGAGGSSSLSSGVTAAIAAVSVLVVVCMAAAARLHLWWCTNLRCKLCHYMRCGRRKPRKGV